jgi:periplasmic protein TonB
MLQPLDKLTEIDADQPEEMFDPEVPLVDECVVPANIVGTGRTDKYLKLGIVLSVLLHITLFVAIPRLGNLPASQSLLKPGEKVTPVRLVEFPDAPKAEEKPPETASAISDRNHTAEKERIPKAPPAKSLLGTIAPSHPKMAALAPPVAPEELIAPKEEQPEEKPEELPVEKPDELSRPKPAQTKKPPVKRSHDDKASAASPRMERRSRQNPVDLKPTPGEIARALSGAPGGDFFNDGDPDEAVVDLNTREVPFFSYLLHLKRKIEGVWVYPSLAARSGIGGQLTVEFLIAKEGQLLGVRMLDSSGSTVLDESAVKAIRSAAPYHPFPPIMKSKRLRVRAQFIYVTQTSFRRMM